MKWFLALFMIGCLASLVSCDEEVEIPENKAPMAKPAPVKK